MKYEYNYSQTCDHWLIYFPGQHLLETFLVTEQYFPSVQWRVTFSFKRNTVRTRGPWNKFTQLHVCRLVTIFRLLYFFWLLRELAFVRKCESVFPCFYFNSRWRFDRGFTVTSEKRLCMFWKTVSPIKINHSKNFGLIFLFLNHTGVSRMATLTESSDGAKGIFITVNNRVCRR